MKQVPPIVWTVLAVMGGPCLSWGVATVAGQSQCPDFGPNVFIFDANMPMETIQRHINQIFSRQERSQFGSGRYAFLFQPGEYQLDVNVGFYTEVLGLGLAPDNVSILGQVHSEADWMGGNATCTFWRSVAGMAVTPTRGTDRWATSQATPFRRMHIKGNLVLDDGGWSSGGFIADSKIDGTIRSGSQQQYFVRNTEMGQWQGGNWNMVFVGDVNPPGGQWPKRPYTVVSATPIVREKPFLLVDQNGRYAVRIPDLKRTPCVGTTWQVRIIHLILFACGIFSAGPEGLLTAGRTVLSPSIAVT